MRRLLALTVLVGALGYAGSGLGLGVIIGEPTGLSAKYWLSERAAVDAAGAWSLLGVPAVHLHADIMLHSPDWMPVEYGDVCAFYGVGMRMKLAPGNARLGIRIPLGIEYMFEELPVGLFLELAPIVDFFPATQLKGNAGVGARYYFR